MEMPKVRQKFRFIRACSGNNETCLVEQFDDGSVAIEGPDVSGIVEERPNAVSWAIAYVESKGYVRCQES